MQSGDETTPTPKPQPSRGARIIGERFTALITPGIPGYDDCAWRVTWYERGELDLSPLPISHVGHETWSDALFAVWLDMRNRIAAIHVRGDVSEAEIRETLESFERKYVS
jgi:hypothetical protein